MLTSWKSVVVHERHLVAMEVHGLFRLGYLPATRSIIMNTDEIITFYIFFRYKIAQHQKIEDRILAASIITEDEDLAIPGTFVIDTMSNAASLEYGAVPERLFVVLDREIKYCGGRGPAGYKVDELREWLQNYTGKSK